MSRIVVTTVISTRSFSRLMKWYLRLNHMCSARFRCLYKDIVRYLNRVLSETAPAISLDAALLKWFGAWHCIWTDFVQRWRINRQYNNKRKLVKYELKRDILLSTAPLLFAPALASHGLQILWIVSQKIFWSFVVTLTLWETVWYYCILEILYWIRSNFLFQFP